MYTGGARFLNKIHGLLAVILPDYNNLLSLKHAHTVLYLLYYREHMPRTHSTQSVVTTVCLQTHQIIEEGLI